MISKRQFCSWELCDATAWSLSENVKRLRKCNSLYLLSNKNDFILKVQTFVDMWKVFEIFATIPSQRIRKSNRGKWLNFEMVFAIKVRLFFKKLAIPGLFFIYFRLFKQTLQFLQQINVKNVHPEYGAGIQTHNHWNISLLP